MNALTSSYHDVEGYEEALELCFRNGWTDGLPVIPPTEERVRRVLASVGREPDEVLGFYPERGRRISVEKVAINAVMAGCLPEYFPVVLAITELLIDPNAGNTSGPAVSFHIANASTGSPAIGFIVNGPIRNAIGMNYRGNVLGSGNRANATIGRAIRLVQINAMGSVPGAGNDEGAPVPILDRATLGQPARYAGFHIPEYEEAFPAWKPLHVERGFAPEQNVVTVFATGGGMQISLHAEQRAEEVAETVAHHLAQLGRNTGQGWLVLIVTPEAARIVVRDGWSKAQLREAIYRKAAQVGTSPQHGTDGQLLSVARGPDDVYLAVAGGPAGGWCYFLVPYGPIATKAF